MNSKILDTVMDDAIKTFAHSGSNEAKTIRKVSDIAQAIDDPLLLMWAQTQARELQEKERDNKAKGISTEVSDLSWNYSKDDFPLHGGFGNALKGAIERVTGTVQEKFVHSAKAFYGKLTESWTGTHTYDIDNIGGFAKDPKNQHVARELDTASQSVIQEINNLSQKAPQAAAGNQARATQEKVSAVEEVKAPAQQVLELLDKDKKSEETQVKGKAEEEEALRNQLKLNSKLQSDENVIQDTDPKEIAKKILAKLRAEHVGLASTSNNVQTPFTPITQAKIEEKETHQMDNSAISPLTKRK